MPPSSYRFRPISVADGTTSDASSSPSPEREESRVAVGGGRLLRRPPDDSAAIVASAECRRGGRPRRRLSSTSGNYRPRKSGGSAPGAFWTVMTVILLFTLLFGNTSPPSRGTTTRASPTPVAKASTGAFGHSRLLGMISMACCVASGGAVAAAAAAASPSSPRPLSPHVTGAFHRRGGGDLPPATRKWESKKKKKKKRRKARPSSSGIGAEVDAFSLGEDMEHHEGEEAKVDDGDDGHRGEKEEAEVVLLLDVDNTLYSEHALQQRQGRRSSSSSDGVGVGVGGDGDGDGGVESQIVANTHEFCRRHFDMSKDECDELYRQFGSTVEGLRRVLTSQLTKGGGRPVRGGLDLPDWAAAAAAGRRPSGGGDASSGGHDIDGDAVNLVDNVDAIVESVLARFYDEVYRDVDVSPILIRRLREESDDESSRSTTATATTGYSHEEENNSPGAGRGRGHRRLAEYLAAVARRHPVYLASNSPRIHVDRVVDALGLDRVPFAGVLTPDSPPRRHDCESPSPRPPGGDDVRRPIDDVNASSSSLPYPTKASPVEFYSPILDRYPPSRGHRLVLLDDSTYNLQTAGEVGIDGFRVVHHAPSSSSSSSCGSDGDGFNLEVAVGMALGHIQPPRPIDSSDGGGGKQELSDDGGSDDDEYFTFSDSAYLRSKNVVDDRSINRRVWDRLRTELKRKVLREEGGETETKKTLRVVDVGAGLLHVLELVLFGSGGGGDGTTGGRGEEDTGDEVESALPSLLLLDDDDGEDGGPSRPLVEELDYVAYEPNRNLLGSCRETLVGRLGLTEATAVDGADDDGEREEYIFRGTVSLPPQPTQRENGDTSSPTASMSVGVTVRLRIKDFTAEVHEDNSRENHPDLIMGCCFADLFDPHRLASSLWLRFFSRPSHSLGVGVGGQTETRSKSRSTLVYFPITFAGTTSFDPPSPFEVSGRMCGREGFVIPSDTFAFRCYSRALTSRHGHNVDPTRLVDAMSTTTTSQSRGDGHGCRLLERGASPWVIDPLRDGHLWRTMMYFLGTTCVPELLTADVGRQRWDGTGWIARARRKRPRIIASNVDLLFRWTIPAPRHEGTLNGPSKGEGGFLTWDRKNSDIDEADEFSAGEESSSTLAEEIQFVAPYRVRTVLKRMGATLAPNEIEVKSVCSLISSGTELKIFKGLFNDDAALDVNIKGMADSSMAYPLAYGYSLVGRVVRCGANVADAEELLGRLVFCFSPHSSRVVIDRDSAHVVPHGIEAEDAMFLPSMETALSLVHDANVRIGERVAVYGQGLIGLLVTAVLCGMSDATATMTTTDGDDGFRTGAVGWAFAFLTAFDALPDRLAASSLMGASQALLPGMAAEAGPFDVSIEVSGNARALQSAIDHTSSGGRVFLGSWYGNADVSLKLGIDFHRSHKTILTSQVSEIPAALTGLWSKKRRFALAWELVRKLKPSRLVTKTMDLSETQEAYELLDKGKEIAVSFTYKP